MSDSQSTAVHPPNSRLVCASAWRRIVAAVADGVLGMALSVALLPLLRWSFAHRTVPVQLAVDALSVTAAVFLLVRFGVTPGKIIARARVVNIDGHFPDVHHALLRCSPSIVGVVLNELRLIAIFRSAPAGISVATFKDMGEVMTTYGRAYAPLFFLMGVVGLVDIATIFANRQRRAIHDFIAGTYVVTSESWAEHATPQGRTS
jgi:uncharacterized RDD family membrane protein YckC